MHKSLLAVGILVISMSPAFAEEIELSGLSPIDISRYPNIVCNSQGAASLRLNDGRMIEFSREDKPVKCVGNTLVSKGKVASWPDWVILGENALNEAGIEHDIIPK
ncbi:hypothetical protein [Cronobacter dublinensis]|uniref:hypothetical protein n=1 Tax=Cronobacter dublinensis TaxID=413497 RepID=UPI0024AFE5AB|nr:hypothetical protein [Cronobacter dublinensis]MDI7502451.1 hypothetical protein [Cronobacter dublinensis]